MPLPPDFRWQRAAATAHEKDVIAFEGVWVVRLYQEHWGGPHFAALDQHLPQEQQTRRQCSTHAQGRAGAELWVARHQDRLRLEVQQQRRLVAATRLPKVP